MTDGAIFVYSKYSKWHFIVVDPDSYAQLTAAPVGLAEIIFKASVLAGAPTSNTY